MCECQQIDAHKYLYRNPQKKIHPKLIPQIERLSDGDIINGSHSTNYHIKFHMTPTDSTRNYAI